MRKGSAVFISFRLWIGCEIEPLDARFRDMQNRYGSDAGAFDFDVVMGVPDELAAVLDQGARAWCQTR